MTSHQVKATIIVAAWRAEDTLGRSVRSALAQDIGSLEVIVVDDASPDGTSRAARELMAGDPRVRLLTLDRNGGPSAARNAAIEAARGEWLAVLDSDDQMQPERLLRMITFAESVGADCVYDDLQPVDPEGRPLGSSHLAALAIHSPQKWPIERFLTGCRALPGQAALGYLKPILRRSFVMQNGLRYDTKLRNGEDFHLIAELLAGGGELWFLPTPGYLYTHRDESISRRLDPDHARALLHADKAFCARHADTLSAEARRLMRQRDRNFADLAAAEIAIGAIKSGKLLRATGTLLRRPSAAIRMFRQLRGGLARRRAA
ncbi:MAG: glycosyl transferase [Mameliella sp.]|nr:glycosyl transferase [Mameliella sp.]|tara:strand:+ start:10552 stop:11505 length:954 start_codon:yes stop_codon:yes gene_type:complete